MQPTMTILTSSQAVALLCSTENMLALDERIARLEARIGEGRGRYEDAQNLARLKAYRLKKYEHAIGAKQ
jgi:hypothetical protein